MPKITSYKIDWSYSTRIMMDVLVDTFPDKGLSVSQSGVSYTVYTVDLSPIGFTGWKVSSTFHGAYSNSEHISLTNPQGLSINSHNFSNTAWQGGGEGYSKVRCTALHDDPIDSLIIAFNSGIGSRTDTVTPPPEDEIVDKTAFVTLFLAKDTKGGIFGGISYGGGGPARLIGEAGSQLTSFQQRSVENDYGVLELASMPNLTDPDIPLAKSMMIAVTAPKDRTDNELKFGTYYLLGDKKYGNLSTVVSDSHCPLIDPWCLF